MNDPIWWTPDGLGFKEDAVDWWYEQLITGKSTPTE